MEDKELVQRLMEFYLTQSDPKTIARSLANCVLDYARFANYYTLSKAEQIRLMRRSEINAKEIERFIKEGYKKDEKLNLISLFVEKSNEST